MKYLILVLSVTLIISGCSYTVNRYSANADNVTALRSLGNKKINVGEFTATDPGKREIICRGGPIKTPDGETFAEFIRNALINELKMANVFSTTAPIMLVGHVNTVDFSSTTGVWTLSLTVKSSNRESTTVVENYQYPTSFLAETACTQTAQALMPAVQNLVGKLVRSEKFFRVLVD